MSTLQVTASRAKGQELHIATAADENYALPAAVTVCSVLRHLSPLDRVTLYFLDGGISRRSRNRLESTWQDPRLQVHWLKPDRQKLERLPVSGHVTQTAYARILLPSLLPPDLKRVIYLDSDLLVQRDLSQLWDEPFQGSACLAIQDAAAPCIDAEIALSNFALCKAALAAARPVPNYREIGLNPQAPYFNSGVLCLNLELWRRQAIADEVLECLRRHRKHVLWWDQYALNVVLHERWRAIDLRWNQGSHIYRYPTPRESPFSESDFVALRDDPWIVHFTSPVKPWQTNCRHPFQAQFHQVLAQTAWKGWRPERPYLSLPEWVAHHFKRYSNWRQFNKQQRSRRRNTSANVERRAA